MRCLKCGAKHSSVRETRLYMGLFVRRIRVCFNEHTFTTYEVYAGNLDRRSLKITARALPAKIKAWALRTRVRLSTKNASALSTELGVSATRVRQLRAEQREHEPV